MKGSGSAFATNGVVEESSFQFLSGENLLSRMSHHSVAMLSFSAPGAALQSWVKHKEAGVVRMRLGP